MCALCTSASFTCGPQISLCRSHPTRKVSGKQSKHNSCARCCQIIAFFEPEIMRIPEIQNLQVAQNLQIALISPTPGTTVQPMHSQPLALSQPRVNSNPNSTPPKLPTFPTGLCAKASSGKESRTKRVLSVTTINEPTFPLKSPQNVVGLYLHHKNSSFKTVPENNCATQWLCLDKWLRKGG